MIGWVRQNWRWLLAVTVTIAGSLGVLVLIILRQQRQAAAMAAELELLRAGMKVAGLRADRAARKVELLNNAEEAAKLEKTIADARRRAVSIVADTSKMSDVEVAIELKKLGY